MSPANSARFKRQFFHADFQGEERLNISLGHSSGTLYTADNWLKGSARLRGTAAIINLVCLGLLTVCAVGFSQASFNIDDTSVANLLRVFTALCLFNDWYLVMTLIWMYNHWKKTN